MMRIKPPLPSRRPAGKIAILALTASVLACDDGSDNPLPNDATVSVTPQTKTYITEEILDADGNCLVDFDRYVDQTVVIRVTSGQGSPIGKADLNISLGFGENTSERIFPMELFDDLNGNGVVDGPEEKVSDESDPVFRTKTEQFTGERLVIVRVNASCAHSGSLNVISDGFVGEGNYEVVAEAAVEDDPATNGDTPDPGEGEPLSSGGG